MAMLTIPSNRTIALLTLMMANVALIACLHGQNRLSSYDSPPAITTQSELGGQGLVLMQQRVESKLAARPSAATDATFLGKARVTGDDEYSDAERYASSDDVLAIKNAFQTHQNAVVSLLALPTSRLRGTSYNHEVARVIAKVKDSGSSSYQQRVVIQLLFAVLYYYLIVRNYPSLKDENVNAEAKALQQKDEISAVMDVSCANNFHALCCSGPRAAHTFHSAGILDYWPACIGMSICPCCMLWATNVFTPLNEKLGGERDGCIKGGACAMCCSCCMIAKDAQTLDLITGTKTEFFSIAPMQAHEM